MLVNAKQSGYRKTFDMKLDSLDIQTKRGYGIALRNFEKFYFEKHGNIDPIKDLKNQTREDLFNELQAWVNWNGKNLTATATRSYFSRIKKYLNASGKVLLCAWLFLLTISPLYYDSKVALVITAV